MGFIGKDVVREGVVKRLGPKEVKILGSIIAGNGLFARRDLSFRELARAADTDEKTAKRLYNRLFAENVCSHVVIPNYSLLGYNVMMIQKFSVKKEALPDIGLLVARMMSQWKNCIDCMETFDGKILMRSVWKSAPEFRDARSDFHSRFGIDWLEKEELEMVPLDTNKRMLKIDCLWDDDEPQ